MVDGSSIANSLEDKSTWSQHRAGTERTPDGCRDLGTVRRGEWEAWPPCVIMDTTLPDGEGSGRMRKINQEMLFRTYFYLAQRYLNTHAVSF